MSHSERGGWYVCRVQAISSDSCNEKPNVGGLSDYSKLSKVIKMILVLFHGQGCVETEFNVNKDMLQPNLEGM